MKKKRRGQRLLHGLDENGAALNVRINSSRALLKARPEQFRICRVCARAEEDFVETRPADLVDGMFIASNDTSGFLRELPSPLFCNFNSRK